MLKCDYRRFDRLAQGQSVTAPQRSLSENALPEFEPRRSVCELSLYVVSFVHIIRRVSRNGMYQMLLPFQSWTPQPLRVFDIRDHGVSQINMHFLSLGEHAFHQWTRMGLLLSSKKT